MGFDIMSLQRNRAPAQARSKADEGRATLKYIDVDDLVPSEDNFYSMSAIDELATLIELSGGVKQPALVVPLGGGKYKVIAGHRRRLASLQLVKQGKDTYRKMPCLVEADEREPGADADDLRAIDEAILLITTNSQREKTDWDKVQEATRLRELLNQKRRFEKVSGETRKLIAEQLGTTPAQVGRYDSIAKYLIPAFKGWLEEGKIGISVAYELSMLPENVQENAAEECRGKRDPVTLEDVRRWKQMGREPEKKPTAGEERKTEGDTAVDAPIPCPAPVHEKSQKIKQSTTKPAGKIVDSPEQSTLPPEPTITPDSPEPEKEPLSKRRVADILADLQMYCEEMLAIDTERPETWEERAEALIMAIAALQK